MPIYNIICFSDKTIVNECNKTDYSIVKVKNIKEFLTRLAIKSYKETGNIDSSIFNVLSYYLRDCFKCGRRSYTGNAVRDGWFKEEWNQDGKSQWESDWCGVEREIIEWSDSC